MDPSNWPFYKTLVGTPTTQIHNFSKRLFGLLQSLISNLIWNHGWRRPRKLLGLRIRSDVVLHMLMKRSQWVIPPRESMIFHTLHSCHDHPSSAFQGTHDLILAAFFLDLESNQRWKFSGDWGFKFSGDWGFSLLGYIAVYVGVFFDAWVCGSFWGPLAGGFIRGVR